VTEGYNKEPSLGEMVHDLAEAGSDLVAAEIRLVEAKLARRLTIAGTSVLFIAAGGAFGFIALLTLMFTLGALLATAMSTVAAAAIVTLVSVVLGAVLFQIGRKRFVRIFGGTPTGLAKSQ
tara:strand:- start:60691 stop:61053 length:363 start_codon:yes stop_codon:yes gene_type:complete